MDGIVTSDYTQATVVHDPVNLKYYFRTYEDQNIKFAELNAFDKEAKDISRTSANGHQPYRNVTKELKP